MSKYEFGPSDIFHNVIKAHPKYEILWHWNEAYINNRIDQGKQATSGSKYLQEINADRTLGNVAVDNQGIFNKNLIYGYMIKGADFDKQFAPKHVLTQQQYKEIKNGEYLYMPYPFNSQISRELIVAQQGNRYSTISKWSGVSNDGITVTKNLAEASSVYKLMALRNVYNKYKTLSKYFDFHEYIMWNDGVPTGSAPKFGRATAVGPSTMKTNGKAGTEINNPPFSTTTEQEPSPRQQYTNLIIIPKVFYGNRIKKGSVDLKFYFTGSLIARAQDSNENGELIETSRESRVGSSTNNVIGTVLYNEGILVITGNVQLNQDAVVKDGYLSPGAHQNHNAPLSSSYRDVPKWAHFGAYKSFIKSSEKGAAKCADCIRCTSHVDGNSVTFKVPQTAGGVVDGFGADRTYTIYTVTSLNNAGAPKQEEIFIKIQDTVANTLIKIKDAINGLIDSDNIQYGPGATFGVVGVKAVGGSASTLVTLECTTPGSAGNSTILDGDTNLQNNGGDTTPFTGGTDYSINNTIPENMSAVDVGQSRETSASYAPANSSYSLSFRGTQKTPVLTMMAHAPKNELNWSNNPTFIRRRVDNFSEKDYDQIFVAEAGAYGYKENKLVSIKNTTSSSFCDHTASFLPQTYISKIGIYNDEGDLIAVAKLATPIRKTNEQDFTFKMKLDL